MSILDIIKFYNFTSIILQSWMQSIRTMVYNNYIVHPILTTSLDFFFVHHDKSQLKYKIFHVVKYQGNG